MYAKTQAARFEMDATGTSLVPIVFIFTSIPNSTLEFE